MVYYKSRGSADGVFPSVYRASVVTDVRYINGAGEVVAPKELMDGSSIHQVRLCVMNPEGMFFTGWLDQGQAGGNWDWMPFQKDQQARPGYGGPNQSMNGGVTTDVKPS